MGAGDAARRGGGRLAAGRCLAVLTSLLAGAGSGAPSPPTRRYAGQHDHRRRPTSGRRPRARRRSPRPTGGVGGFIKKGGTYYVYANVTDTGNPASGVSTVNANVSAITSGSTAATLTAGTFTVDGVSYNRRSASLTAGCQPRRRQPRLLADDDRRRPATRGPRAASRSPSTTPCRPPATCRRPTAARSPAGPTPATKSSSPSARRPTRTRSSPAGPAPRPRSSSASTQRDQRHGHDLQLDQRDAAAARHDQPRPHRLHDRQPHLRRHRHRLDDGAERQPRSPSPSAPSRRRRRPRRRPGRWSGPPRPTPPTAPATRPRRRPRPSPARPTKTSSSRCLRPSRESPVPASAAAPAGHAPGRCQPDAREARSRRPLSGRRTRR